MTGIPPALRLVGWLGADSARRRLIPPAATTLRMASRLVSPLDERRGLAMLLASQRFRHSGTAAARIRSRLADDGELIRSLTPDDATFEQAVSRTLVLERPRLSEGRLIPGVLLVTFTDTLRFYAHHVDLGRLQSHFRLILEPSWAGYAVPDILSLHDARDPIIVETADAGDRAFLTQLGSSLVPIAVGAGDWVDHRVFRPLGLEREYDAAYVANYSPGKRIHVFLRAVRDANRRLPFRAALVCAKWGAGREVVQAMFRRYGVAGQVDLYESLTQPELNEVLNRSRCNVLMSLKEGSNRSLFESMFSGLPAILLDDNVGVNRENFGPQTGAIVKESQLADAMIRLSDDFDSFAPREWAMENISPEATTRKISAKLGQLFPQDGPDAYSNLIVKTNTPEAEYFDHPMRGREAEVTEIALRMFLKRAEDRSSEEIVSEVEGAFGGHS